MRFSRVAQLEHHQRVDVVVEGFLRAGERQALVVLARHLAGGGELALRPVAHDLHPGLAVDHHRRGGAPFATGGVGIDVAAELLQRGEHLDHLRSGEGRLVLFDEGLAIAFRTHLAQHQVLEHGAVLPRLAAMGQRRETGGLELVGGDEQFVEGGRRGGAGLLEHFRVDVEPVHPVYVDRHCYVVAVVLHDLRHLLRQQAVPLAFGGHRVEVGEQAQFAPLLDIRPLDLRRGRRIAGHRAGLQHGHRRLAATAGHGEVLPGVALGFDQLLQGFGGALLAGGGPPVQHFDFAGLGQQRGETEGGKTDDGREATDRIHEENLLLVIRSKSALAMLRVYSSVPRRG